MCISSNVVVGNLGLIGEDKCRGMMAKESTPTITTTTTLHFCSRRFLLGFVVLGIFYGLIIVDAAMTTTTTTSVENNGKPISRISFGSCSNQTAPQVRNKQNSFVCLFVSFFLSVVREFGRVSRLVRKLCLLCNQIPLQSFKSCKKTVPGIQELFSGFIQSLWFQAFKIIIISMPFQKQCESAQ
jgi:hypothetical protein